MNKQTSLRIHNAQAVAPFTLRPVHQKQNAGNTPQQKFTPASRNARINSWHQRMQGLFARQSY